MANNSKNIILDRQFVVWSLVAMLVSFMLTFGDGFWSDIQFWVDWSTHLSKQGYEKFPGNYPPLYVHWLWCVGNFFRITSTDISISIILKFVVLLPVYLSQQFFIYLIWKQVRPYFSTTFTTLLFALTALNPAIYLDGPVWGQVDILATVPLTLSLLWISDPKMRHFASTAFVVAILTKFQSIAVLPVFGGVFLRHFRSSIRGVPLAILAILIIIAPFMWAGSLEELWNNAFAGASSMYPFSSLNAGNLWMLVHGNSKDIYHSFLPNAPWILPKIFTPNILGRIFFILFSLLTLFYSIFKGNRRNVFGLAALNAWAFFALLPGMHERYMFMVVPLTIAWAIFKPKAWPWTLVSTFLVSWNIILINPLAGEYLWTPLSILVLLGLLLSSVFALAPNFWSKTKKHYEKLKLSPKLVIIFWLIGLTAMLGGIYSHLRSISYKLQENEVFLHENKLFELNHTDKFPVRYNRSTDNNLLRCNDRIYEKGIGLHAPSHLYTNLPSNADSLFVETCLDNEVAKHGRLSFSIKVDGHTVWKSPIMRGGQASVQARIPLKDAETLELLVHTEGDDRWDHANWINPVIKLREN
ncbi:MAG: hypothetical protein GX801_02245 [Fibrobacter sp.]|nr:hypothetical protein [Fibrobacter sp.]